MKIDNTILDIFKTIKSEVKEKYKLEVSDEELLDIVNSQTEAFKLGILKGFNIAFTGFGKFVNIKRKDTAIESVKFVRNLQHLKELNPELDDVSLRQLYILQKSKEKEELIKNSKTKKSLGADEVLEEENKSSFNSLRFRPMHRIRTKKE